ncbi:Alpha/beta hydrolase family protein [compost metagenome]
MKKKLAIVMLVCVVLLTGMAGYILQQNSFRMVEQAVEINTPQGKLTGTLVLPEQYMGKLGLVLFIHGDGPIDATHDDGYKPLWEKLASLGYASLSLDKRGVGGSEGDWLNQSMEDRVQEARQALAWARTQPMIDPDNMGVWGASQAGWVIPKLAGEEKLAFSILVSPAINWLTQGEYNTRSQMAKNGSAPEEIEQQVVYENRIKGLLKQGASYEEYVRLTHSNDRMSPERWDFVRRSFASDATQDLHNFKSPVLLLLGERDMNVDTKETEQVYRDVVNPTSLLMVRIFADTEHSMLRTSTADSPFRALLISLFAPRSITVEGYTDEIERFLIHTKVEPSGSNQ